MRNVVCVEKIEQAGNAFVFGDAEQVRGAADAERSQVREPGSGPELDAEFRQTFEQVGVVNAHVAPDAPLREESRDRCWRG